ncbi:hypothetical protein [Mycoplasma hafezii]|uniref:hypothetical protein n=1 Tax=Mycoplasma hafezii TaxID=525886 RepID=UPI003CF1058D
MPHKQDAVGYEINSNNKLVFSVSGSGNGYVRIIPNTQTNSVGKQYTDLYAVPNIKFGKSKKTWTYIFASPSAQVNVKTKFCPLELVSFKDENNEYVYTFKYVVAKNDNNEIKFFQDEKGEPKVFEATIHVAHE